MTEVSVCTNLGCIYCEHNECLRTTVILDADGQCIHKNDSIQMYDKGAGESSWHEGLK